MVALKEKDGWVTYRNNGIWRKTNGPNSIVVEIHRDDSKRWWVYDVTKHRSLTRNGWVKGMNSSEDFKSCIEAQKTLEMFMD